MSPLSFVCLILFKLITLADLALSISYVSLISYCLINTMTDIPILISVSVVSLLFHWQGQVGRLGHGLNPHLYLCMYIIILIIIYAF